ncbi:hypothetical protein RND71_035165 [Anisodus tanguticus]|uniref:NAC domain-containing protein n=1 Tax=Anisodus tanguticus TaxID=243964 RepID=A0AAE1R597_9SOLA|nr:hypothetical protein RND71_035165 [Anisodus tanguticus]
MTPSKSTGAQIVLYVCNVAMGESTQEEGWVVCRIFKKQNDFKSLETINSSTSHLDSPNSSTSGDPKSINCEGGLNNWIAVDRLVASHLNGQTINNYNHDYEHQYNSNVVGADSTNHDYQEECDLWSFSRGSTNDSLCHVSNGMI